MAATNSQWWRRLVNAYGVKVGMVYLRGELQRFSRWGVPLLFTFNKHAIGVMGLSWSWG